MSSVDFNPKCIATTGDVFCNPAPSRSPRHCAARRSNFFRSAQFSADGTTIITHNEDSCLRSFVLPTDLLDDREEAQVLTPYSTCTTGSNIQSFALYPGFNLQDPATTLVLSASADVPITLKNALSFEHTQASYAFVHPTTEEYRKANSLAFTRDGTHFLAGSDNCLAMFDCHRNGEGPVSVHKPKPGKGSSASLDSWSLNRKGIVSAISVSNDGVVAIGTYQREIGLYDNGSFKQCSSSFAIDNDTGAGVTDLKWSPDGTYLLVAERNSYVIQVYDVRYQRRMVTTLSGRAANTLQRLNIDLIPTAAGYEVWAGGTDGSVRMWSNPGSKEGDHAPDATLALHQAPVSSAIWHPAGVVLATCSGDRPSTDAIETKVVNEQSDDSASDISSDASIGSLSDTSSATSSGHTSTPEPDNALNVWTL